MGMIPGSIYGEEVTPAAALAEIDRLREDRDSWRRTCERLTAELALAQRKIDQFIHGEENPDQYVTIETAAILRRENESFKAEFEEMQTERDYWEAVAQNRVHSHDHALVKAERTELITTGDVICRTMSEMLNAREGTWPDEAVVAFDAWTVLREGG